MKAIEYRGQNEFYLFDKPEEPDFKNLAKDPVFGDYKFFTGYKNNDIRKQYEDEFKANLSAGKKIINPEVMEIGNLLSPFTAWFNKAKPGDIFPLPDNIGFEEMPARASRLLSRGDDHLKMPINGTVIRLFLKEEPNATCDGKWYCGLANVKNGICENCDLPREPSPVDEWAESWEELNRQLPNGVNPHAFILGWKAAKKHFKI